DPVERVPEIDAARDVRADGICEHGVVRRERAVDPDPVAAVPRDEVASRLRAVAERVPLDFGAAAAEEDSVLAVAERGGPGGVRADEVPRDRVLLRGAGEADALL